MQQAQALLFSQYMLLLTLREIFKDKMDVDKFIEGDKIRQDSLIKVMKQAQKQNFKPDKVQELFKYIKEQNKSLGIDGLRKKYQQFIRENDRFNEIAQFVINQHKKLLQQQLFKGYRLGVPEKDTMEFLMKKKQLMTKDQIYKDISNPKIKKGQEYRYADKIFNDFQLFGVTDSAVIERAQSRFGVGLLVEPKDVIQGEIENCYLMSSIISIISKHPELIDHLFLFDRSPTHYYVVKLFIDGQWKMIETDDQFPVYPDGRAVYARSHAQKIWVMLLEKCYAKQFGSYQDLDSGPPSEGFRVFTGAPIKLISLDKQDKQIVLKEILQALEKQFVISICTKKLSHEQQKETGLVESHAYSILKIIEIKGEKIVKMMNPWGIMGSKDENGKWKGPWSFYSQKWTPELKKQKNYEVERDDGVFYISWNDFTKYFNQFTICKVTPSYVHSSHKLRTIKGKSNYFFMEVAEQGQYYLSVYHESRRKHKATTNYDYPDTRLVVIRMTNNGEQEYIDSTNVSSQNGATVETQLKVGKYLVAVKIQWGQKPEREVIFCTYGTAHVEYEDQENKQNCIEEFFINVLTFSFSEKFRADRDQNRHEPNMVSVFKYLQGQGELVPYIEIFASQQKGFGYLKIKNPLQKPLQIDFKAETFEGFQMIKKQKIDIKSIIKAQKEYLISFWVDASCKKIGFIPKESPIVK